MRFLEKINTREGLNVFDLKPEVTLRLEAHGWPGNVRELEHVVEDAAYRASVKGRTFIDTEDLRLETPVLKGEDSANTELSFTERVRAFKNGLIHEELKRQGGNILATARVLNVDRQVVRNALKDGP